MRMRKVTENKHQKGLEAVAHVYCTETEYFRGDKISLYFEFQ